MAKQKKPSKKMLKDLEELFAKHNWTNAGIITTAKATTIITCPTGQKPYSYTYKDAAGNWVTTTICIPI